MSIELLLYSTLARRYLFLSLAQSTCTVVEHRRSEKKTLQREISYKNLSLPKCIPFPYELNIIELSIVPVQ